MEQAGVQRPSYDELASLVAGLIARVERGNHPRSPYWPGIRPGRGLLYAWRQAILVGLAENPSRPGWKQSKTRNLLERLRDREDLVLRFAHDLSVSFSNNQAERDLRPTKTQMKKLAR